jgi:hypothetical protein
MRRAHTLGAVLTRWNVLKAVSAAQVRNPVAILSMEAHPSRAAPG